MAGAFRYRPGHIDHERDRIWTGRRWVDREDLADPKVARAAQREISESLHRESTQQQAGLHAATQAQAPYRQLQGLQAAQNYWASTQTTQLSRAEPTKNTQQDDILLLLGD